MENLVTFMKQDKEFYKNSFLSIPYQSRKQIDEKVGNEELH